MRWGGGGVCGCVSFPSAHEGEFVRAGPFCAHVLRAPPYPSYTRTDGHLTHQTNVFGCTHTHTHMLDYLSRALALVAVEDRLQPCEG